MVSMLGFRNNFLLGIGCAFCIGFCLTPLKLYWEFRRVALHPFRKGDTMLLLSCSPICLWEGNRIALMITAVLFPPVCACCCHIVVMVEVHISILEYSPVNFFLVKKFCLKFWKNDIHSCELKHSFKTKFYPERRSPQDMSDNLALTLDTSLP